MFIVESSVLLGPEKAPKSGLREKNPPVQKHHFRKSLITTLTDY